jgi:hypothetical protein
MAVLVYALCVLTASTAAVLLLRSVSRRKHPLLLWSGLCFLCLAVSNGLLLLDKLVFPMADLSVWRLVPALLGISLLLYGLISSER